MHCTIVIPCLARADLTRACLESLLQQRGGPSFDVVLVDNANDPQTQALAAMDPRITVLPQARNLGFAGACNLGLQRSRGDLAMVLNNDTQAAPSLLARLTAAVASDARIGFVAPISNRVKGPARVAVGELGKSLPGRIEIEQQLDGPLSHMLQDTDTLSGLCLLGRTATWQTLGGFDERFFPGNYEDDDLCLRARLLGLRLCIARGAFLHHEAHQSFRQLGIQIEDEVRRQFAVFAAKWRDDPAGQATLLLMQGRPDEAAAAAASAARVHPRWPDADWILGRWHGDQGRHREALPHLQACLRRCPSFSEAIVRLVQCQLAVGEAGEARRLLAAALQSCWFAQEQSAGLLLLLGECAERNGDLETAARDFAMAVEVAPEQPVAHNRLGAALIELRRFEEALPHLEAAAAAGLALAHTNLGICHFHRGDAQRALQHFANAAQQLPNDALAQANYDKARAAIGAASNGSGLR